MDARTESEARYLAHDQLDVTGPNENYGFAWNHPRFSDKTLRVIISPAPGFDECYASGDKEILQLPVNSAILAKESQYFLKLFGGYGFRDSDSKTVDIHIKGQEKKHFLRLLESIYKQMDVRATEVEDLIGLWTLADRFLVNSCSRACLQKLLVAANLGYSHAVKILDAAETSAARASPELQTLLELCTTMLTKHFKNLSFMNSRRHIDTDMLRDLTNLPQPALEALLRSDQLPVEREETAFYALILWVKGNAGDKEENRVQAMAKLAPLIRFPFMKADVLSGLIEHPELASPECQKLVVEGLQFRTASSETKLSRFRQDEVDHRRFRRRSGYLRPMKAMIVELPQQMASLHFSTTAEELEKIVTGRILSFESFRLSGCVFALRMRQATKSHRIALDIVMCSSAPPGRPVPAELVIYVWSQQQSAFLHIFHAKHTFQQENALVRCGDIFGKELKDLLAERHHWVCEGQFFLSAEIVLRM